MTSLWEEQKNNSANNTPTQTMVLATAQPQDLVMEDYKYERALEMDTNELVQTMFFSEKLSKAAFQIADYVPNLQEGKNSDFWKKKVIPTLVESLTQDVKSRNAVVHAMASVRDLAICIQKGGEIVKATQGSKKAIEIAQRNIPMALEALEKSIATATTLENAAVKMFQEHAEEFFEIIGPSAAEFAKQKADCDAQIIELEKEKQLLIDSFADLKGELDKYNNLVHVAEVRINGAENALKETRLRCQQMEQLNSEVDNVIKSIPDTIPQTVTTHHSGGWWFWSHNHTTTSTTQAKNPDKDSEKNYYESVIAARAARIKEKQSDASNTEELINKQRQDLAELKGKYETTKEKYERAVADFSQSMNKLQERIKAQREQLDNLEKSALDVETKTGLKGKALIDCLVAVRAFTKSNKDWAQMYAPLAAVLQGIKEMVKQDVELLGGDDACVFLAGNRLLRMVGFLSQYSINTRQMIGSSQQLDAVAIATELNLTHKSENIIK